MGTTLISCDKEQIGNTEDEVILEPVSTQVFYVSPDGDDSHTRIEANDSQTPWKTIQNGINNIQGGDTLLIAGGVYHEKILISSSLNGTQENPTVIKNVEGDSVVIEGDNEGVQWESLFKIDNAAYIRVKGLKAQNGFWYGFSADKSDHITFENCYTENTQASGIYASYCTFINILNNKINRACQKQTRDEDGNGSQECITVTRTNDFIIDNNEIWDVPLHGVGGEGIDAKGASYNGVISHNNVHDIARVGIYLDAGSGEQYNIRVFGNKVKNSGGGLSVAGELGGHLRNIYLYNNLILDNESSGVVFQDIMNGRFSDIYIVNNTFYNNAKTGFAGDIANYSTNELNNNLVIANNIFYNETENFRFSIFHNLASSHVISHNLYYDFKPGWAGEPNNFSEANLTDDDILLNPNFMDIQTEDFALNPDSPAIDAGKPITLPSTSELLFTTDFEGNQRGSEFWNMGAF